MDLTSDLRIIKCEDDSFREVEDQVAVEFPLKIIVNDQELVTMVCSPDHLEELAVGYLYSEGLISKSSQIEEISLQDDQIAIYIQKELEILPKSMTHQVITSGCGRSYIHTDLNGTGLKKVYSQVSVSKKHIYQLAEELSQRSDLFRQTGGVHNTILTDSRGDISVFREDIGRHNAIDKLVGYLVLKKISAADKILVTTGRISAEILLKTARPGIPILISRSAPTDLAIRLASRLGITVIGFVRGKRMNVYTHGERIK